jgi:hypothetical protein
MIDIDKGYKQKAFDRFLAIAGEGWTVIYKLSRVKSPDKYAFDLDSDMERGKDGALFTKTTVRAQSTDEITSGLNRQYFMFKSTDDDTVVRAKLDAFLVKLDKIIAELRAKKKVADDRQQGRLDLHNKVVDAAKRLHFAQENDYFNHFITPAGTVRWSVNGDDKGFTLVINVKDADAAIELLKKLAA